MTVEESFERLIVAMMRRTPVLVSVGRVVSVDRDGATCEVERDEMPGLLGVRLNAVTGGKDCWTVYPRVDSYVLCVSVEGAATDAYLLATSDIDEVMVRTGGASMVINSEGIVLNDGKNGMVDVGKMVTVFNRVVNGYNTHTHVAPGGVTGVPATLTATIGVSDIENLKVKQ